MGSEVASLPYATLCASAFRAAQTAGRKTPTALLAEDLRQERLRGFDFALKGQKEKERCTLGRGPWLSGALPVNGLAQGCPILATGSANWTW
jgi:hypothetical protein